MSYAEVRFREPAPYLTLGRNGLSIAAGVSVTSMNGALLIEPINSKGAVGRARVVVPVAEGAAFLDAIRTHLPATPPPEEATARPVDARLLSAAEAVMSAFGGDWPDWLRCELAALETAIRAAKPDA